MKISNDKGAAGKIIKEYDGKLFGSVPGSTSTKLIMKTETPETAKAAIEAAEKAVRAHRAEFPAIG